MPSVSDHNRTVGLVLQQHAGHRVEPVQANSRSTMAQKSAPCLVDEAPWILSAHLMHRFQQFGDPADLQQAITVLQELVGSTPIRDVRYSTLVAYLGAALSYRFDHVGELSDLEEAISRQREAVGLTPHGRPDKPTLLTNLGNSFSIRFERLGELSDLEDAISTLKNAADLTPDGHPHKPGVLNSLGNSYFARFKRFGELSDLEDAISKYSDAVGLTPHGHPHEPDRLDNLGSYFRARFEHLGGLSDLEDPILALRDAVDLTPDNHPHKHGVLNSLGNSFLTRFEHFGDLNNLEGAISKCRDADDLTPHGHLDKPGRLNNLGNPSLARFKRLREPSDFKIAISAIRNAVDPTPHCHPDKPGCLNNLGCAFFAHFQRSGELSDLEDAISRQKEAVDLTPGGHPDNPDRLINLGNSFRARFGRLGELSDVEQAISLYSHAASASIGPISVRFRASRKWITCAQDIHHHSLLDACSLAITLLPQLAWTGFSLSHRYSELMQGTDVVREAAAAALQSGLPDTAVEWLEQGRSIVWGELFRLRSSYEELSSAHPHHARRLRELSIALEHTSVAHEKSLSALSGRTASAAHHATESLQQEADRHRTLAIERDQLLQEIRGFPDFEGFLLHKQFSQLRASAHSGPVVILNAAESHCDALIIRADVDHVIHVPLPNFTFKGAAGLQNALGKLLGHAHVMRFDAKEEGLAIRGDSSWEYLLSTLWTDVVKPVLDALAFTVRDIM